MIKTTVYLPEPVKKKLAKTAKILGTSEASLIRSAIERLIRDETPTKPRVPLFASDDPMLSEQVDEALTDFGN